MQTREEKRQPGDPVRARHRGIGGVNYWVLFFALILSLAPSLVRAAEADHDNDNDNETIPADFLQTRLISWHTIGGTNSRADTRMVGLNLRGEGWPGYVERYVIPQIQGGVRRILIHNPWGITPGEPMEFDQHVEANEAGMLWLTRQFVETWAPVVRGDHTDGEPVEVICYLGAIDKDTELVEALERGDGEGSVAWLERTLESIRPALGAGMSFGFDSANDLPLDSPEFRFIELLRSLGHRVYVEPRPIAAAEHLHDLPVISTAKLWDRTDPERYPGTDHMATNAQLTDETIILLRGIRDDQELLDTTRRYLLERTESVAVPLRRHVWRRVSLDDWVNPKR